LNVIDPLCVVVVFDQLVCRYSIEWKKDSENHFDIDPVEGTLSVSEALDRERKAEHNVTVVATKVSKYDGLCFIQMHRYNMTSIAVLQLQLFIEMKMVEFFF